MLGKVTVVSAAAPAKGRRRGRGRHSAAAAASAAVSASPPPLQAPPSIQDDYKTESVSESVVVSGIEQAQPPPVAVTATRNVWDQKRTGRDGSSPMSSRSPRDSVTPRMAAPSPIDAKPAPPTRSGKYRPPTQPISAPTRMSGGPAPPSAAARPPPPSGGGGGRKSGGYLAPHLRDPSARAKVAVTYRPEDGVRASPMRGRRDGPMYGGGRGTGAYGGSGSSSSYGAGGAGSGGSYGSGSYGGRSAGGRDASGMDGRSRGGRGFSRDGRGSNNGDMMTMSRPSGGASGRSSRMDASSRPDRGGGGTASSAGASGASGPKGGPSSKSGDNDLSSERDWRRSSTLDREREELRRRGARQSRTTSYSARKQEELRRLQERRSPGAHQFRAGAPSHSSSYSGGGGGGSSRMPAARDRRDYPSHYQGQSSDDYYGGGPSDDYPRGSRGDSIPVAAAPAVTSRKIESHGKAMSPTLQSSRMRRRLKIEAPKQLLVKATPVRFSDERKLTESRRTKIAEAQRKTRTAMMSEGAAADLTKTLPTPLMPVDNDDDLLVEAQKAAKTSLNPSTQAYEPMIKDPPLGGEGGYTEFDPARLSSPERQAMGLEQPVSDITGYAQDDGKTADELAGEEQRYHQSMYYQQHYASVQQSQMHGGGAPGGGPSSGGGPGSSSAGPTGGPHSPPPPPSHPAEEVALQAAAAAAAAGRAPPPHMMGDGFDPRIAPTHTPHSLAHSGMHPGHSVAMSAAAAAAAAQFGGGPGGPSGDAGGGAAPSGAGPGGMAGVPHPPPHLAGAPGFPLGMEQMQIPAPPVYMNEDMLRSWQALHRRWFEMKQGLQASYMSAGSASDQSVYAQEIHSCVAEMQELIFKARQDLQNQALAGGVPGGPGSSVAMMGAGGAIGGAGGPAASTPMIPPPPGSQPQPYATFPGRPPDLMDGFGGSGGGPGSGAGMMGGPPPPGGPHVPPPRMGGDYSGAGMVGGPPGPPPDYRRQARDQHFAGKRGANFRGGRQGGRRQGAYDRRSRYSDDGRRGGLRGGSFQGSGPRTYQRRTRRSDFKSWEEFLTQSESDPVFEFMGFQGMFVQKTLKKKSMDGTVVKDGESAVDADDDEAVTADGSEKEADLVVSAEECLVGPDHSGLQFVSTKLAKRCKTAPTFKRLTLSGFTFHLDSFSIDASNTDVCESLLKFRSPMMRTVRIELPERSRLAEWVDTIPWRSLASNLGNSSGFRLLQFAQSIPDEIPLTDEELDLLKPMLDALLFSSLCSPQWLMFIKAPARLNGDFFRRLNDCSDKPIRLIKIHDPTVIFNEDLLMSLPRSLESLGIHATSRHDRMSVAEIVRVIADCDYLKRLRKIQVTNDSRFPVNLSAPEIFALLGQCDRLDLDFSLISNATKKLVVTGRTPQACIQVYGCSSVEKTQLSGRVQTRVDPKNQSCAEIIGWMPWPSHFFNHYNNRQRYNNYGQQRYDRGYRGGSDNWGYRSSKMDDRGQSSQQQQQPPHHQHQQRSHRQQQQSSKQYAQRGQAVGFATAGAATAASSSAVSGSAGGGGASASSSSVKQGSSKGGDSSAIPPVPAGGHASSSSSVTAAAGSKSSSQSGDPSSEMPARRKKKRKRRKSGRGDSSSAAATATAGGGGGASKIESIEEVKNPALVAAQ